MSVIYYYQHLMSSWWSCADIKPENLVTIMHIYMQCIRLQCLSSATQVVFHLRMTCIECGEILTSSSSSVIPKSPPPACRVGGRNYRHGQSMEVLQMTEDQKEAVCDQCICDKGKLNNCHHLFNCSLNNPNCASYVKKPGQCCPECGK